MIEREYKRRHTMLWRDIVDYLHKVKIGEVKIYYDNIADLKHALLHKQNENSGVVFTGVYHDCYACEFVLIENGNNIGMCVNCPLINKLGCFCLDEYSAYALLTKAYKNKDYEKAIALAIRIRDAWREEK